MTERLHLQLLLLSLGLASSGHALAINKCTQKDGKVVYQDAPCQTTSTGSETVKTWGAGQASPSAPRTTSAGTLPVDPNTKITGPQEAGALLGIYRRWADAERLASSTARVSLAGPVATMQAVQREAEVAVVPACLTDAKEALVDLTSKSTTALINFMRKNELQSMTYTYIDRDRLIAGFEGRVSAADCSRQAAQ